MRFWKSKEEKAKEIMDAEAAEQKRWTCIGSVEGRTIYIGDDGEPTGETTQCYWVLRERDDGLRKAKKIGSSGRSKYSIKQEAAVESWLSGGPVPSLEELPHSEASPKKKNTPGIQKDGNVITLPTNNHRGKT